MTVNKQLDGDTLIVMAKGSLDTLTAPLFHEAVQDLDGAKNVTLDFSGVDYVSSAGLRETVALFRRVSADGGTFSVRGVSAGIMDVFTLTGFDKKFEIRS